MSKASFAPEALSEIQEAVEQLEFQPNFIYAFYDCAQDDVQIFSVLRERFPNAPIVGGTSCSGVMTDRGFGGANSIGLLLIEDPDGNYGSATIEVGAAAADSAERALIAALEDADCPGELPELIWIYQAPGQEEAVLEGIRRVVDDKCPVIGGSSADADLTGAWRQLGSDGPIKNGLVVGVLFTSGGIGFAFQGGYEPTGPSGVVTRIGFDPTGESGIVTQTKGRLILAIDGEPAASVYNQWIGGSLSERLGHNSSILVDTTLCPLGIDAGNIGEMSHYLLLHPETITTDGGLATFATIEEGTRIFAMRGSRERLIERAGRVVSTAITELPGNSRNLAGGVVVYCGGCMLAVGDDMPKVADAVAESFGGAPFIGCFTYGEQGLLFGKNVHGNLMISAITFGQ